MKQEVVTKRIFIWNVIGCVLNSAASFLLLAFVTRSVEVVEAGYFSIAFATAQLLLAFGKYGVRAFQATDVNCTISFKAFVFNRILTSVGMIFLSVVYVIISGYNMHKAVVVVCVCSIKVVDAVEDVFHGELQLIGKMDIAGKLLTGRNLFTILCFGTFIFYTHDLIFTCWFTAISSLSLCLLINWYAVNRTARRKQNYQTDQIYAIFKQCFPLFISAFLSILIYNIPKYAIDSYAAEEIQTVYNIIFMPAFVINMISEFIFKPLLTPLAHFWKEKKLEEVKKIIIKLHLYLLGITIVVLVGGYLCGIPLLELVYSISLSSYKKELLMLLAGGGFSAAVYLSYNLLTMMRAQELVFPGYVIGAIVAVVMARYLVEQYGITGAAMTYLGVEILMCGYFQLMIYSGVKKYEGGIKDESISLHR